MLFRDMIIDHTCFSFWIKAICVLVFLYCNVECLLSTPWSQLDDVLQLIGTPQGIEEIIVQLKDTLTKVYVIGAEGDTLRMPAIF